MHWLVKQEKVFLGDFRSDFSKVWALQQLGILELIESKNVWSDESPELLELVKRGKDKKVASALGMGVGQSTPTAYLRRVCRLIGVKLKHDRKRKNKKQITLVSIYQPALHDPDRLVILECIDRRLQKYVTGEIPVMDWGLTPTQPNCHTPVMATVAENETAPKTPVNQPQTQIEQELQPVQVFPDMYNKHSKTCTANEETITPQLAQKEELTIEEELEVEDCLSILNPVDNEELLHDREFHLSMMAELKGLSQRIKCAFWSRLPNWRRLQLKQWQMGNA